MSLSQRHLRKNDEIAIVHGVNGRTNTATVGSRQATHDGTFGVLVETSSVHNQLNISKERSNMTKPVRGDNAITRTSTPKGRSLQLDVQSHVWPEPPHIHIDVTDLLSEDTQRESKMSTVNPIKSNWRDENHRNRAKKILLQAAAEANIPLSFDFQTATKAMPRAGNLEKDTQRNFDANKWIPFTESITSPVGGQFAMNGTLYSKFDGTMRATSDETRKTSREKNEIQDPIHEILDCSESDIDPVEIPPLNGHVSMNGRSVSAPGLSYDKKRAAVTDSHELTHDGAAPRDASIHNARLQHKLERTIHLKNSLTDHESHGWNTESSSSDSPPTPPGYEDVHSRHFTNGGREGTSYRTLRGGVHEHSIKKKANQTAGVTPQDDDEHQPITLSKSQSTVESSESKHTACTADSDSTNYTRDSESIDYNSFRRFERKYDKAHGIQYSCIEDLKSSFWIESGGGISVEKIVGNFTSAISDSLEAWRRQRRQRRRETGQVLV